MLAVVLYSLIQLPHSTRRIAAQVVRKRAEQLTTRNLMAVNALLDSPQCPNHLNVIHGITYGKLFT